MWRSNTARVIPAFDPMVVSLLVFLIGNLGEAEKPCSLQSKAVLGQSGCEETFPQIPSAGLWACVFCASSFNAAGVGSFEPGDRPNRGDHLGDRAKNPAVKSSTMKGSTENVREGLPVSELGDGAKLRTSTADGYPKLLYS